MLRAVVRVVAASKTPRAQPHFGARGGHRSALPPSGVPTPPPPPPPPPDQDPSMLGLGLAGVLYTASIALTGYALGAHDTRR